ncbi:YgjP-like metallopeptidase domain-containing protein [Sulfurimonas sp.]|jgi:UTP pyrophosphatase|uniref:YgjP-like metallopeptidase domain-containing protein n=1 Tax=Sulfurimonas sp. TaxID=2022749 RepID=UPI0025E43695|nr:YgjP-like metallopeptidase domain-containing protein [Sulfurimonas sp.]MBT5934453.1 M48 family metallopeptidase [Sulfurimonas sp.]
MKLKYLKHYPISVQEQVVKLIKADKLKSHLLKKYPNAHNYKNDKTLFSYTMDIKNEYLKKSPPLSKTHYDGKINVIHNALGTHHFISRVQGSKLKAKNEIKIASMFKSVPKEFLEMIVVHELAHFKEKEHNKAFYKLCEYMMGSYHQVEFDLRLYLTHMDRESKFEEWGKANNG